MEEGYGRLFAAIYKRAVQDDMEAVCARIQRELVKKVHRRHAIDYISDNKDYIKEQIQKNVYEESKEWGEGTTREMQQRRINSLVEEMVNAYE